MKKKLLTILTILGTVSALGGCGDKLTPPMPPEPATDTTGTTAAPADSDYAYITGNGKMVIGITYYEPMNYKAEDGSLTGFDTEFAEAVCAKLGVTPEFQEIDWEMKETELKSRNIDCIWNGLTVTEDRRANMDFSKTYLINKQCVVVNKDNAAAYTDTASLSGAMLSAESGSAGETAITSDSNLSQASYTASNSQQDALIALNAGNYDAIVIDYTMALSSVGSGDFANLTIVDGIELANEEYAIGFRIGSDMTAHVDGIIDELIADGTLESIASHYEGLTDLYNAAVAK
ncbi:MAG: transporter substrate-binding domain-containing protein [Lachnospiraceae bacterium]|nr:transporter substrate-binding domain-containing protein [Lachnospiraceae bacterium]MBP3298044.1 transporter substrate-binding domain-containing protein [Lachnospiraceae bacterium]